MNNQIIAARTKYESELLALDRYNEDHEQAYQLADAKLNFLDDIEDLLEKNVTLNQEQVDYLAAM